MSVEHRLPGTEIVLELAQLPWQPIPLIIQERKKSSHKRRLNGRTVTSPISHPTLKCLCLGAPSPGKLKRRVNFHPHKEFRATLGAPSFFVWVFLYVFFFAFLTLQSLHFFAKKKKRGRPEKSKDFSFC